MTRNRIIGRAVVAGALALATCGVGAALASDDPCVFNGKTYSDGAISCQSGRPYKCDDGEWEKKDGACQSDAMNTAPKGACEFGGVTYSAGSAKCQDGTQYRCEDGEWTKTSRTCPVGDAPMRIVPSGRTCMFDGATVAHNSTICRSGSTYLCSDGDWMNLGTECR
jgi:hypothetical protein